MFSTKYGMIHRNRKERKHMDGNLAYKEEPWEEELNGNIVLMSPRPSVNHNRVASKIFAAFYNCLKGKSCEAFADGTDVYLTEKDHVIPDVMIVCNQDIIKENGVHGAPDLVVEVLSPGTAKNDRGYKKDLYEKSGVKEYWIADPMLRSIEAYILSDGTYVLDEIYALYPDGLGLTEHERTGTKKEIQASLYDDLHIPLEEIFSNLF